MNKEYGDKKNLRIFIEPHVNSLYYRRKREKGGFKAYDVIDIYNDEYRKFKGLGQVMCSSIPVLSNRTQDIFDFSKI